MGMPRFFRGRRLDTYGHLCLDTYGHLVCRVFFAVAAWTPMDTYAWTPMENRTVWGPRAGIIF